MTDLDGAEISKAISKYETMTLGSFRSQYKMDEYPQFLTSIEVRGYGRGYVDGVVHVLEEIDEEVDLYAQISTSPAEDE